MGICHAGDFVVPLFKGLKTEYLSHETRGWSGMGDLELEVQNHTRRDIERVVISEDM